MAAVGTRAIEIKVADRTVDYLQPRTFTERHPLLVERMVEAAAVLGALGVVLSATYCAVQIFQICRAHHFKALVQPKFWLYLVVIPGATVGAAVCVIEPIMERIERAQKTHDVFHPPAPDANRPVFTYSFKTAGATNWLLSTNNTQISEFIDVANRSTDTGQRLTGSESAREAFKIVTQNLDSESRAGADEASDHLVAVVRTDSDQVAMFSTLRGLKHFRFANDETYFSHYSFNHHQRYVPSRGERTTAIQCGNLVSPKSGSTFRFAPSDSFSVTLFGAAMIIDATTSV